MFFQVYMFYNYTYVYDQSTEEILIKHSKLFQSSLLCNHLPKEDLTDVYLYLKYHCLLSLCCRDNIQQLVVWQEVNSTRQMFDLGEEQVFGYTEPVDAKLIWLIVGYVSNYVIFYTQVYSYLHYHFWTKLEHIYAISSIFVHICLFSGFFLSIIFHV